MRRAPTPLAAVLILLAACSDARRGHVLGFGVHRQAQAVSVICPGASTLPGADVSSYDSVDWPAAADGGLIFAIARISDGLGYPDPTFAGNWAGMADAGIIRGSYQFYESTQDPTAQANLVVQAVGALGPTDLPVAFDMESGDPPLSDVFTWMSIVEAGTGKVPMVYTGWGYWNGLGYGTTFANQPLWVANYGVTCPGIPEGWNSWVIWQPTGTGTAVGINSQDKPDAGESDLDVFNGTLGDLLAFAQSSSVSCGASPAPCTGDADCCLGLACQTGTCQAAAMCSPLWGACTSAAECCTQLSCLTWTPDGQPAGTYCCEPVGASCSSGRECCGGTLCTGGACACVPQGTYCQNDADCCSGLSCQSGACQTAPSTASSGSSGSTSTGGSTTSASAVASTSSSGASASISTSGASASGTTSSGAATSPVSTSTSSGTASNSGATASSTRGAGESSTTGGSSSTSVPGPDAGVGAGAKSGCASALSEPSLWTALWAGAALLRRRRARSGHST